MGSFRIVARAELCAGSAGCQAIAPHLFGLDEKGWVRVIDERPPREELAAALEVQDACPLGAIEVIDDGDPTA